MVKLLVALGAVVIAIGIWLALFHWVFILPFPYWIIVFGMLLMVSSYFCTVLDMLYVSFKKGGV